MSGSYGEDIRDVKRPYRKKAFQTGYSQKGSAVSSTPLPQHTYSTTTTQQTEAQRPGVDPHTFRRAVRPNPRIFGRRHSNCWCVLSVAYIT